MGALAAVAIGLLVAYANGANDNFKGVATLYGSGTTSYRRALLWAGGTTLAGSLTALVLARGLLTAFSGKGLVPADVLADPGFAPAVALGAGVTVLLATRLGFPTSTTHALIGGIAGAGLAASPAGLDMGRLGGVFVLPLLTSPFLAIAGALLLYPPLSFARRRLGVEQETCLCVGSEVVAVLPQAPGAASLRVGSVPAVGVGTDATCRTRYHGAFLGMHARPVLDAAHYASAGMVSFARGLNDTPKIAALLLAGGAVGAGGAVASVGAAIGLGGLLSARRVAETMSGRITEMNPGQGFTANAVTSALVIGASSFGMPVSTTHVSCGALFGIGTVTGGARWRTIGEILTAWVITLPVAAAVGAGAMAVL